MSLSPVAKLAFGFCAGTVLATPIIMIGLDKLSIQGELLGRTIVQDLLVAGAASLVLAVLYFALDRKTTRGKWSLTAATIAVFLVQFLAIAGAVTILHAMQKSKAFPFSMDFGAKTETID